MRHLWTDSQVICLRFIPASFDQNSGDKKKGKKKRIILVAFWSSSGNQNKLVNVFRTWFVFENKLSIIKCLFLDTGVDLSWWRLIINIKSWPNSTVTKQRKKGYFLDQSLGFSYSKHPITFSEVPFTWRILSACIPAVFFNNTLIEPFIAALASQTVLII